MDISCFRRHLSTEGGRFAPLSGIQLYGVLLRIFRRDIVEREMVFKCIRAPALGSDTSVMGSRPDRYLEEVTRHVTKFQQANFPPI